MIYAATGHRPDKLGGYSLDAREDLISFAINILPKGTFITGIALGWDQAVAEACLRTNQPYIAAVPFLGQEDTWPSNSIRQYRRLLDNAEEVHYINPPGYAAWKMQKRNQWMVDRADAVLALWNGSPGGTANCVAYALSAEKSVSNVWTRYLKYTSTRQ